MDGTPTVAEVDGEFVRGEYCSEWWHAETRMAKPSYHAYNRVQDLFPEGEYSPSAGEWISTAGHILTIATGSDAVLKAMDGVDEHRQVQWGGSQEFAATAAFGRKLLIKLLQSIDGDYVRLELQNDGLLRAATVNWKFQGTMGLLALITESARERLIDERIAEFEDAVKDEAKGEHIGDDGDEDGDTHE